MNASKTSISFVQVVTVLATIWLLVALPFEAGAQDRQSDSLQGA